MPSGFHTWSQTSGTNASADSAINWAEGQAPSSINDSARAEMAVLAKWRDDINGSLTTGGTSTALTLTTNTVFTSLALMDKQILSFTMNATSGAAPTLNVDGLGTKPIRNATGVTLPTGALLLGSVYHATYYNTAGEWLLHNMPGVLPTSSVTTTAIADAAVTFAKLDNLAQNTVIGRYTASSGVPQALTLSTGLAVNSSTGAVTTTTNPSLFPGFLSGLELSTAGSSATFGIAVGGANDSTNATLMVLTSAYTKTTSAWAVGSGNGALDTGTIAPSTWYHDYLIERSDTGVVDVLISTSASSPTMPANYDRKRRIGSKKTDGSSQWTKFIQVGDNFLWDSGGVADVSAVALGTSTLYTLSVPTGVSVMASIASFYQSTGTGSQYKVWSPLITGPGTFWGNVQVANDTSITPLNILTNTSGQIRASSNAQGTIQWSVTTLGWSDSRGK